jgi:hypothetical protein
MTKFRRLWCLVALFATGTFFLSGWRTVEHVSANNNPQTIPFTQNWTANLITTNDDWSPVNGIVGFLGDDPSTTVANIDARNYLQPFSTVDVIAQATPVSTTGGVGEMDALANPTIALQGSGTADAPNIVLYLNTTGQSNIQVAFNARDVDPSPTEDAVQQLNVQYRVGSTGNFINVPGGYFADVTTVGTDTQVTPVSVTLPVFANNRPAVEVRILTTNAAGSDEWVGIDDINVTTTGTNLKLRTNVDFSGDNKADYVVTRPVAGNLQWWIFNNGGSPQGPTTWGLSSDQQVVGDFDGDQKVDIAVWRSTDGTFYILNSASSTIRVDTFGQAGDDPSVVADYNGDGRSDVAVYRAGATIADPSNWYYKTAMNVVYNQVTWGMGGDRPVIGDYDGDLRSDFTVRRNVGLNSTFFQLYATGAISSEVFGPPAGPGQSTEVPGDYDGDGRTDLAIVRAAGDIIMWDYRPSSTGGATVSDAWGRLSLNDQLVPGDYTGDGKSDYAVWRPGSPGVFYVMTPITRQITLTQWGITGDEAVGEAIIPGEARMPGEARIPRN